MDDAEPIDILGVRFARLPAAEALLRVERLYAAARPAFIAHANVHTVNLARRDPAYRALLGRAGLVLNDGKGVMLGARLLGRPFPADLNGNFFSPLVVELAARKQWPTYLVGAKPGVARRAAGGLRQRYPGLQVAGIRDGYFGPGGEEAVVEEISRTGATLLLVGLGNPRQEQWLDRRLEDTGARLGIGVGAFFDFQAGAIPRAPAWMNRAGLEWVHRLAHEPRRMWRRYLVGNPAFLAHVVAEARRERRRRR